MLVESKNDNSTSEVPSTDKPPSSQRVKSRTSRACDRCRVKKAKCDGRPRCKQCDVNDSVCMYTARRGREVREYYSRMCKITDEAIQILFASCRQNGCFPGDLPHPDQHGHTTTNAVLQALGLIQSADDEPSSNSHPIQDVTFDHNTLPREGFGDQRQGSQHSTSMASPASGSIDDAASESQVSEIADNLSYNAGHDYSASSYFEPISDTNLHAAYLDHASHQADFSTFFALKHDSGQDHHGHHSLNFEGLFDTSLLPTPRA